jgi:hypothetical protein
LVSLLLVERSREITSVNSKYGGVYTFSLTFELWSRTSKKVVEWFVSTKLRKSGYNVGMCQYQYFDKHLFHSDGATIQKQENKKWIELSGFKN